eukprot:GHRR01037282.1.p1 GENE.GHRR01037282.1~~GHRR01037282.1.p1  ORF type:complete len:465 (+),score=139.83 GHRR01037282.1:84-1478(+)
MFDIKFERPAAKHCLLLGVPQGVWNPCFAVQRAGEARVVPLHTPTSANLEFWEQHQHDMVLFNVGLVTQDAGQQQQQPVPINAVDLATNSEWFRALVKHLPALDGTDLGAVVVPCAVSRHILESGIVRAIYRSSVMLDAANVEAIYRAADAMQIQSIVDACESYLYETATTHQGEASCTFAVFDLVAELHRSSLAEKLAAYYAALAQRDVAAAGPFLRHILQSSYFCNSGKAQLQVLREGFQRVWQNQAPEILLLHVLLEVRDVLNPADHQQILDGIHWEMLQQEEVLVLVHWTLQLPADHAFTHGLQARVLTRVAQQLNGCHDRRYLTWKLEVGQLPGNGQRVASSQSLRLRHRRFYLVAEHIAEADWGLFLCPAPDVSLASRVTTHTLFVLGKDLNRRVGFKDCHVPSDTRIGVGFGDKTALSGWMEHGFVQVLGDGSKHIMLGTIVTAVPSKEIADTYGLG